MSNSSFISLLIIRVIVIVILHLPVSFPLSFNLSTISLKDIRFLNLSGAANVSHGGIQVTPEEDVPHGHQPGRATYLEPLRLWDRASGNLTDFSTRFSFVISSRGSDSYADGLAFFLAPVRSTIQPWSYGGSLGLGNNTRNLNSSAYSFVAVEFDTYRNDDFDPASWQHVGIDINSMVSVNTTPWMNNISEGAKNEAWISYDSNSTMLRVEFTGVSQSKIQMGSLSYAVDLRQYLPEYVAFGFSAATGNWFETHTILSWQFSTTLVDNVTLSAQILPGPGPPPRAPIQGPGPRPRAEEDQTAGLIVGLSVGLAVVVPGVALASYCLYKKKKYCWSIEDDEEEEDLDMDMEFEKGSGAKKFSYRELVLATKNFTEEGKLGEGGFGGVYRGFLSGETDSYNIAVKRVSRGSEQGLKEYASEVKIISQLRHRNLVQLLGWCHQRGELLLVYEFMPNGSLDSHLFKSKSMLAWDVRYKIAQGLASALLYLHEEWERCVVHRDIKSSNIMLDSSFNVKLGDFGLARLVDHEKGSQTTVLAGTMGYMAPECVITGRASKETDVYSFGIVLLEIACGRRPIERRYRENTNQVVLLEWVWSLYGIGSLTDGADPKLSNEFDEREMEQMMIVGLWCAHPDSDNRPSIRQAIHALNFQGTLPSLPPTLPVPTYMGLPMNVAVSSTDSTYSGTTVAHPNKYSNYSTSSEGKTTALLSTHSDLPEINVVS